jgi:hypothetical protein
VIETQEAPTRRRLLMLLGVGGAAAAASQFGARAAEAEPVLSDAVVHPEDFGALGDGQSDDTDALNAALQAARPDTSPRGPGLVQLAGKTYAHAGQITVPDGVQVNGMGHFTSIAGLAGSVLKATGSAAEVWVRGSGSGLSNLMVDGNSIAATGIHTGGTATGDDGADQWYCNVVVAGSMSQNWLIEKTQNSTVINCRSNVSFGEGVVIDRGVGGFVFTRCEFNSAQAGPNLRVGPNGTGGRGYPAPTDLMFIKCQAEYRADDGPEVRIEGGSSLRFDGLSVYHPTPGHTSPLIDITGNADVQFDGLLAGGNPDKARPAIKVGYGASAACPAVVSLHGETRCFGIASLLDVKTYAKVLMSGPVTGLQGDANSGIALASAGTDPLTIRDDRQCVTDYRLSTAAGAGSFIERGFVQGEAQPRFIRDVNGGVTVGPGVSTFPDVTYGWRDLGGGAHALQVVPSIYSRRFVHPTAADLIPVSGIVTVDAAVSDRHAVSLNTACTATLINNMVQGQYLTVLFKQPASADTFGITSVTGSGITDVQWSNGAAPTLITAQRAVACTFMLCGTVLYEVARSSTEPPPSPGWTSATLGGNVKNYGNGYSTVGYRRFNVGGIVALRLRGAVCTSVQLAAKTTLFVLPTGYCPPAHHAFACQGGGILVKSTGEVQNLVKTTAGVMQSLDGIEFHLA